MIDITNKYRTMIKTIFTTNIQDKKHDQLVINFASETGIKIKFNLSKRLKCQLLPVSPFTITLLVISSLNCPLTKPFKCFALYVLVNQTLLFSKTTSPLC